MGELGNTGVSQPADIALMRGRLLHCERGRSARECAAGPGQRQQVWQPAAER